MLTSHTMSEKKLDFEPDDQAPPYYEEEPTTPSPAFSDRKHPPLPSLQTQRTETRTLRIQNLLTTSIEPSLHSEFLDGICKRAFLIIPSDILTQQPNLATTDIIGLPSTNTHHNSTITLIRLHGPANRSAFWAQRAILSELASSLRARLAASGYKVEAAATETTISRLPPPPALPSPFLPSSSNQPQSQPQPLSSSWFKKPFSSLQPQQQQQQQQQHDPTASTNYKLGWRSETEDDDGAAAQQTRSPLAPDEVRVLVQLRDVSFRVETLMGLLDSVGGKVVWVEVEVGS